MQRDHSNPSQNNLHTLSFNLLEESIPIPASPFLCVDVLHASHKDIGNSRSEHITVKHFKDSFSALLFASHIPLSKH